ncbi:MAG: ABC transporter ATP-binding protein, partial [Chloroflexota bacterium]
MLEVDQLVVRYGAIEALRGVSLTVDEGEIVGLIGANGAGKSTTIKLLSGMLASD